MYLKDLLLDPFILGCFFSYFLLINKLSTTAKVQEQISCAQGVMQYIPKYYLFILYESLS